MTSRQANLIFNKLLLQTVDKALSELAFMIPGEVGTEKLYSQNWDHLCKVDFSGPFSGELHVGITNSMLMPLAENMIGVEPGAELPEGVCELDALKELLNVICGNLLPEIEGQEAVFDISAPEVLQKEGAVKSQFSELGNASVSLDEGKACFVIFAELDKITPMKKIGV